MFDFSFTEIGVIGMVALVVLGPERLPKVARTAGEWLGKAQRYVNQVKADINREMDLAELKKLQEEARAAAASVKSTVTEMQSGMSNLAGELQSSVSNLGSLSTPGDGSSGDTSTETAAWDSTDGWPSHAFRRRYKPGPSIDQLADELARVKRQLALPDARAGARHKYAARARLNRPRIHR